MSLTLGQCPQVRGAPILMTAAEFRVIFQATKEAHSLPPAILSRLSWDNTDVSAIIDFARSIQALTDRAELVRIWIGERTEPGMFAAIPKVMDIEVDGATTRAIVADLSGHLGYAWNGLIESVVTSLGPRELFLRTGYSPVETRAAASRLPVVDLGAAN